MLNARIRQPCAAAEQQLCATAGPSLEQWGSLDANSLQLRALVLKLARHGSPWRLRWRRLLDTATPATNRHHQRLAHEHLRGSERCPDMVIHERNQLHGDWCLERCTTSQRGRNGVADQRR